MWNPLSDHENEKYVGEVSVYVSKIDMQRRFMNQKAGHPQDGSWLEGAPIAKPSCAVILLCLRSLAHLRELEYTELCEERRNAAHLLIEFLYHGNQGS